MISVGKNEDVLPKSCSGVGSRFFLKAIITVECEGGVTGSDGLLGSQCRVSNLESCMAHCWAGGCNSTNFVPILSKFRTGLLEMITRVVVAVSVIQSSGFSPG